MRDRGRGKQCAIEAVESLLLLNIHGAVLVDGESHMTVLDSHLDAGIDLLGQLTLRTLYGNDSVLTLLDANTGGDANWQFSYS